MSRSITPTRSAYSPQSTLPNKTSLATALPAGSIPGWSEVVHLTQQAADLGKRPMIMVLGRLWAVWGLNLAWSAAL